MIIGSLFSGIGGLELGLERALNGQTIWQVEQNEYCRRVLKKHWPNAERTVHDVRNAHRGNLTPVQLLCAGWPCTGFSVAGPRTGLAHPDSALWWEVQRICDEIRPQYLVLENTPSARHELGAILRGMASLGYHALWGSFPASAVGASHRRNRFFMVCYLPDPGIERYTPPGKRPICPAAPKTCRAQGKKAADPESIEPSFYRLRPPGPGIRRNSYGVPSRVDRLASLGNACVPQWAFWVGQVVHEIDARHGKTQSHGRESNSTE